MLNPFIHPSALLNNTDMLFILSHIIIVVLAVVIIIF